MSADYERVAQMSKVQKKNTAGGRGFWGSHSTREEERMRSRFVIAKCGVGEEPSLFKNICGRNWSKSII